ncbi:isochorismatase family protein YddQ [Seminavis robusta]|uniref:Isochorismatase family protein YddQ n=1 Tax=Seminavis robusta TaxID=568900 RepID=A0A9N8DB17_9STRA|nr:isochorismatase family protein YddQ [Seminavis robusta]|eukprot:Sro71_g039360.1 isochorismatase family protein YddQ (203) ;mRNA; r:57667-58275
MATGIVTLRQLTGQPSEPSALKDSALILIDIQNTYLEGVMALEGAKEAVQEAKRLLDEARAAKRPVIHIVHDAGPGTPYDVTATIGKIVDAVAPVDDEPTITKKFISSFTQTDLHEKLQALNCNELIVAGFMTHMCVNSTTRSAFELGYRCTVVGNATATRALPGGKDGRVVDAKALQESSLSELGDMFAVVVNTVDDLKQD